MRDYEFCTECGAKVDLAEAGYHNCNQRLDHIEKLIDEYFDEYLDEEEEGR